VGQQKMRGKAQLKLVEEEKINIMHARSPSYQQQQST